MPRGIKERKGRKAAPREARRYSKLPREEIDKIDYKNVALLQRFITERGKIRGRRVTGLSRRDQSKMALAVKRSREVSRPSCRTRIRAVGSRPPAAAVVAAIAKSASPNENHSQ